MDRERFVGLYGLWEFPYESFTFGMICKHPTHSERFVRFVDFPAWFARFVERFVNGFYGFWEFRCESFTSVFVRFMDFPAWIAWFVEQWWLW